MSYANAEAAGFSQDRLDDARAFADANKTAALVAVYRGHVVAAWGAVDRPMMAHSVRKSLAGALYGQAIASGRLRLTDTLESLGINDEPALTGEERRATFKDLITSRSGVYHAAAYADASQERERPARGSHDPGTFFYYNNWDFNAAETIFERVTGEDLFAAFAERIARPLGMEDYDTGLQMEVLAPGQSQMPAHTMRLSARDLARFGQLYLRGGKWGDQQIVPADWVRDSLQKHSDFGDGTGYGYLWWIYEPGSLGDRYPTLNGMSVRLARGTGGQTIFLLPETDMVVVHRADTDNGRSVPGPAIWQLVERLVSARVGEPAVPARLVPMEVLPLASNLPAPVVPQTLPITAAMRARVVGQYQVAPGAAARVFEVGERLFMSVPGQGEAELFATGALDYIVKVELGVRVRFEAGDQGIVAAEVTIGPQRIRAIRIRTPSVQ
jgi:CubicO group peptidase (beta-lactamase class C family)